MKNHYKFWIIVSFLVIFAAGTFSGVILEKYILKKDSKRNFRSPNERGKDRLHFPTVEEMARDLNLTEEQQSKMQEVFDNSETRLKKMSLEIRENYSSMRVLFIEEIKSVLNEEQIKKLDEMIENYLSKRKEEMEKRKRSPNHAPPQKGEEK